MIHCYNCNQWKPGEVAPFAICDDCKQGGQKPVTEQKAFYEIERPAKKTYIVVVREIVNADVRCDHITPLFNKAGEQVGALLCDTDWGDFYECEACGRMTCEGHLGQKELRGLPLCNRCEKLPVNVLESIQKLRRDLNR